MTEEYGQKALKEVLTSDEVIQFQFSVGERYRKQSLLVYGLLLLPLLFISFFMFKSGHPVMASICVLLYLWPIWRFGFYSTRANIYALTNKRVIVRRGWLSAKTQMIGYKSITDLAVEQNFLERKAFHTGNILVNTAGHLTNQVVLKNIENPRSRRYVARSSSR
jgi:uncharacterized membrane protein YdbT with pleckstrin-like domain